MLMSLVLLHLSSQSRAEARKSGTSRQDNKAVVSLYHSGFMVYRHRTERRNDHEKTTEYAAHILPLTLRT